MYPPKSYTLDLRLRFHLRLNVLFTHAVYTCRHSATKSELQAHCSFSLSNLGGRMINTVIIEMIYRKANKKDKILLHPATVC